MDVNRHPQKINYYLECEKEIKRNEGRLPKLLLHSCCAPCSSAVLEYLSPHFDITLFYFNPNITPEEEYRKRVAELHRLVREAPSPNPVRIVEGRYDTGELSRSKQARMLFCAVSAISYTAFCDWEIASAG